MKKTIFLSILGLFLFVICTSDTCNTSTSQEDQQTAVKMKNVDALMKNQPNPQIPFSMDRYLLNQRLVRFNDPNKMSYLYIVLQDGSWLKLTIVGKLASTSKRLTSPEEEYVLENNSHNVLGPAPDEMGTYGSSEPAKVGMSTLGSLIEFGGFVSYLYSEVPLTFSGLQHPVIEIQPISLSASEKQSLLNSLNDLKEQSKKAN